MSDNNHTSSKPKKIRLSVDKDALKKLSLVAVAYSHVEREDFPTQGAYDAEVEVEDRADEVAEKVGELGIDVKLYPGDQYFLTNLLVDKPDVVINLVDTFKGKDRLQTSVPAALELSSIPYTGAGMEGLIIGNNRNLTKRLLVAYDIPTPAFQFVRRVGSAIDTELGLPLIVKLNEGGGSVGIDGKAVKETIEAAQKRVDEMISTYRLPVIVERFIDGPEITVVVFDDGDKKSVFMAEKVFKKKTGKHYFTSLASYDDLHAYKYKENASLSDLQHIVKEYGFPIGVEWQGVFYEDSDEDDGHYSVVTYVDTVNNIIMLSDPYRRFAGSDRTFHIMEFDHRWWDENEITDQETGRKYTVREEHMMFVVTPKEAIFPEQMGMVR